MRWSPSSHHPPTVRQLYLVLTFTNLALLQHCCVCDPACRPYPNRPPDSYVALTATTTNRSSTHVPLTATTGTLKQEDPHPVNSYMPEGPPDAPADIRFRKVPEGWTVCDRTDATSEELRLVRDTVKRWDRIFARSLADMPGYCGEMGPVRINLKTDDPIIEPRRHHSRMELEAQDLKCRPLADAKFIRPSSSAKYGMEVVIAAKKDEHGLYTDVRFCLDARPLNAQTIEDPYSPPTDCQELFDRIGTHKWLTKCDCRAAFNQMFIHPDDQEKTSFFWRGEKWCLSLIHI